MDRPLARARSASQLLHRRERLDPAALVRRLLAVQAQDGRAAALALRARSEGLTAAAIEGDDELVVAWLNRGTLHLVHRDDHPWLLALTAPTRFANNRRRLGQEGVSPQDADRAVAIVRAAVAEAGPLTRSELAAFRHTFSERSEPAGIPELVVAHDITTAFDLLRAARPGDSNSDLRRLLRQGAVTINGVRTDDPAAPVDLGMDVVLKSGARTWHRIRRE